MAGQRIKPSGFQGIKEARKQGSKEASREEIVALKVNCGIALLHRVVLLLQVPPFVRTWVWGRVGAWKGSSGKSNSCDASNGARRRLRAVSRRARKSNGI